MKAIVVYESHWGNTAAVARAIARGIGPDTPAVTTELATPAVLADADLIVAGAPVVAFGLPGERTREGLAKEALRAPTPPDLSHPSMREWLEQLPAGRARFAACETRIRWSPGGATGTIERGLRQAGHERLAEAHRFLVTDRYGPLKDGELERARAWGEELAARA